MKKLALSAMVALALVLTFTQCKKESEKPEATEEKVFVTLTATIGQNEDRTDFNTGNYSFVWTSGATEYVYVGGSQHSGCFGLLYGTGTGNGTMNFSGYLTSMPQDGETLYFFYLGKGGEKSGDALTTLDISNQDGTLANLTNNHIAVSYGIAYNGSLYFDATFYMMTSFAYFNTSGFGNETVRLHGEQVYSKAIVNFSEGTIAGSEKGNISIGSGSNGVYVALIPSTTSQTTLEFDGSTKTGSIDFLRGIQAGRYYCKNGGALEVEASALQQVDLSTLTGDYEAQDGDILTNTLDDNYKISIADGATVTLDGVTINGEDDENYSWAGITCLGNATIILKDGTENTVKGFFLQYPGIYVPVDHTLIIKGGSEGSGKLTASSNGYGAGIGGGARIACGNIEIQGGDITATGGGNNAAGIGSAYEASCGAITISGGTVRANGNDIAAGIGGAYMASCGAITISGGTVTATGGESGAGIGSGCGGSSCGDITISGGTVTATGGMWAAGIGSGYDSSCGAITITTGVTKVTATKGEDALNSIGAGNRGTCGTVTIGGVVYYENNAYVGTGSTYLTQSPLVYEP